MALRDIMLTTILNTSPTPSHSAQMVLWDFKLTKRWLRSQIVKTPLYQYIFQLSCIPTLRCWFPCVDHASVLISYDVTVRVTSPKITAAFNGKLVETITLEDDDVGDGDGGNNGNNGDSNNSRSSSR